MRDQQVGKLGFLSDVHGDVEACEWAIGMLGDCAQLFFCGDVCGGRQVESCIELLRRHGVKSVAGNHDLWDFEWTGLSQASVEFLKELPIERAQHDFGCVHSDHAGGPAQLRFHYIYQESDAARAFAQFPWRLTFFGHSHTSQIFTQKTHSFVEHTPIFGPTIVPLAPPEHQWRYLVNVPPPSVAVVVYDVEQQTIEYRFPP